MIRSEESLGYHAGDRPGKIEVRSTKPCLSLREMRLAYLPGATFPAEEIARDPSQSFRYTARGNLVAVVSNGSAVPGLGAVGAAAAKPMLEGIAILFKRLADLDVFDLEIESGDREEIVHTMRLLQPTFGGVILKDFAAPLGLEVYEDLKRELEIPVFHENLYSTAVVAAAALINALDLTGKRIEQVRVVLCGAGTVGTGCARLFTRLGVAPENLLVYDARGLLHPERDDLPPHQRELARRSELRRLEEGLADADVFVGASAAGVLTPEMIRTMNRFPIILALATPEPEIGYEAARTSRRDAIVATALGQYPNAVLDLLSCPYILRGALDVQATRITEGMLLAAVRALANLAREDVVEEVDRAYGGGHFTFGPEYLLPKPIDPRILAWESSAVTEQAIADGVARAPVEPEPYRERLTLRLGARREALRAFMIRARSEEPLRVVFSEGANETVIRACGILVEEGIARPILLGREQEIGEVVERLGVDLSGTQQIDPEKSPRLDAYAEEYFRLRRRRGVIWKTARGRVRRRDCYATMMLQSGDADMVISGITAHYSDALRTILEVVGPAPGVKRISSYLLAVMQKDLLLLADCAVNIDPSAEDLAETALLAARTARGLGIDPRVAMLSFSNFGSVRHAHATKVRRATELVRHRAPDLVVDGEMQLDIALNRELRREYFPFSNLVENANVLVFPDLQSGNLSVHLLQHLGQALQIGPLLMGTRLPVHLVQYGMTAQDLVNLATVGIVEAAAARAAR